MATRKNSSVTGRPAASARTAAGSGAPTTARTRVSPAVGRAGDRGAQPGGADASSAGQPAGQPGVGDGRSGGNLAVRASKGVWLGLAHSVGAGARRFGRDARGLPPEHRRDGAALALICLALVVAAQTWFHLSGAAGGVIEWAVAGSLGVLGKALPVVLVYLAVRLMRHPEKGEDNGRISIGFTTLIVALAALIQIGCHLPSPSDGWDRIRAAGGAVGLIGTALAALVTPAIAFVIFLVLAFFGLLVLTKTPVVRIPRRIAEGWAALGLGRGPAPAADVAGPGGPGLGGPGGAGLGGPGGAGLGSADGLAAAVGGPPAGDSSTWRRILPPMTTRPRSSAKPQTNWRRAAVRAAAGRGIKGHPAASANPVWDRAAGNRPRRAARPGSCRAKCRPPAPKANSPATCFTSCQARNCWSRNCRDATKARTRRPWSRL